MQRRTSTKPIKHVSYLSVLEFIAEQSHRELAALMPHLGERGRITEDIVRNALSRILPRRYSLGTGVLISFDGDASAQTDIVIYDNFHNSPLLAEFGAFIFPVESVFATIEVKSVLNKRNLRKSLQDIIKIRMVGSKQRIVIQETVKTDRKRSVQVSRAYATTPPRSYIVAFRQEGLGRTYEAFAETLRAELDVTGTHVHGVFVLNKKWFAKRQAYQTPARVLGGEGVGLLGLYREILAGQQNFSVGAMDLDAYLEGS